MLVPPGESRPDHKGCPIPLPNGAAGRVKRRLAFALPIDTNPELDELLAHLSALMT
jgi:hypothetical protein